MRVRTDVDCFTIQQLATNCNEKLIMDVAGRSSRSCPFHICLLIILLLLYIHFLHLLMRLLVLLSTLSGCGIGGETHLSAATLQVPHFHLCSAVLWLVALLPIQSCKKVTHFSNGRLIARFFTCNHSVVSLRWRWMMYLTCCVESPALVLRETFNIANYEAI